MGAKVLALVTPALLGWARKTSSFSLEQAAEKLGIEPTRLAAWESGAEPLTVPQLRKCANVYKRPLALFFLPEPPKHFTPMKDFRRLPATDAKLSPDLALEVRRATQRREVALDLARGLGDVPRTFPVRASTNESPTDVAARLRDALGVSISSQESWGDEYAALREWRAAVEGLGVLVFRAQKLDPREARGFSIGEDVMPVVVLSSKDSAAARVFTLMHELAHVALRTGGVCDFDERRSPQTTEERIEVFCNAVAGETLLPSRTLASLAEVKTHTASMAWSDDQLRALARRFGVSQEVVLRRLVDLGKASPGFYQAKRSEWQGRPKPTKKSGFERQDEKVLREHGRLFTRLVLESYHDRVISLGDVTEFLSVKAPHIEAVEKSLYLSQSNFA